MSKISILDFKNNPNIVIVKKLGKGSYGSVYQIIDKVTNIPYAIKTVPISQETDEAVESNQVQEEILYDGGIPVNILREVMILKKMNHENIISLRDFAFSANHVHLCLEYCDTDWYNFINSIRKGELGTDFVYNEKFVKKLAYQLILGCEHLHSHCIIHRDLKPGNLLIKSNDNQAINLDNVQLKIADFGLSRRYSITGHPYSKDVQTLWYWAPELLLGSTIYNVSLDIWSIGCIIAEMILGRGWFSGSSEPEQLKILYSVYGTFTDEILPGIEYFPGYTPSETIKGVGLVPFICKNWKMSVSDDWLNWIERMWIIDPTKRICLKEALEHKWFREDIM